MVSHTAYIYIYTQAHTNLRYNFILCIEEPVQHRRKQRYFQKDNEQEVYISCPLVDAMLPLQRCQFLHKTYMCMLIL